MKLIISIAISLMSVTVNILAQPSSTNVFKTYQDCFRFMLDDQKSQLTDNYLFKVAADSSIERYWFNQKKNELILVVKLDYVKGPYSQFRGAQDNGAYFMFLSQNNEFKYVGQMGGNSYKYHGNQPPTFSSSWHWSAQQAIETVYKWDNGKYAITEKILYQYDPAGGPRKKVRDYLKEK